MRRDREREDDRGIDLTTIFMIVVVAATFFFVLGVAMDLFDASERVAEGLGILFSGLTLYVTLRLRGIMARWVGRFLAHCEKAQNHKGGRTP